MFTKFLFYTMAAVNAILCVVVINALLMFVAIKCDGEAEAAVYINTSNYHLIDLNESSIDLYQIADHRNGYSAQFDNDWTKGFAINTNFSLLYNLLFLQSRMETFGTDAQIREAGLWWTTGVNLSDYFQIYYQHHSDHLLDSKNDETKFILENYYGVRIILFKRR